MQNSHMTSRRAVTFEKLALEPTGQVTATHTLGHMKSWEVSYILKLVKFRLNLGNRLEPVKANIQLHRINVNVNVKLFLCLIN
jgi:hypothetical protein